MNSVKFGMFFSVFVAFVGLMIIAPVMPPLVRELGLHELHAGIIVSMGSVSMAIMAPLWGSRSDRWGRKPVILFGFAGVFVCYALFTGVVAAGLNGVMGSTAVFALLLLSRVLVGGFIPAVPAAAQAYMADVTDASNRASGMALLGAANGLGLVLGPALAGVLALIGLIWPLYGGTLLPLIALVLVWWIVPHRAAVRSSVNKPPRIRIGQSGLRLYLGAGMVMMLCIITLQVIGGFYLQDQLVLDAKQTARTVSFGLMICGFAMVGLQAILMKLGKLEPKRQMMWGALLLTAGFTVQILMPQLWMLYVGYLLFGLGAGLVMPGFMTGASLSVSAEQQGGIAGLVGMVQGLAAVVAPLLSTMLYRVDKLFPYMLCLALVAMLALVLFIQIARERKGRLG